MHHITGAARLVCIFETCGPEHGNSRFLDCISLFRMESFAARSPLPASRPCSISLSHLEKRTQKLQPFSQEEEEEEESAPGLIVSPVSGVCGSAMVLVASVSGLPQSADKRPSLRVV